MPDVHGNDASCPELKSVRGFSDHKLIDIFRDCCAPEIRVDFSHSEMNRMLIFLSKYGLSSDAENLR